MKLVQLQNLHPAIVSIYDQGVVNGSGYLVMELIGRNPPIYELHLNT